MLNYGYVNPGGPSGPQLWEYSGGIGPDRIQTAGGVTGIKNPLLANIDFKQWFVDNELGFDYVGGTAFNDGTTVAAQFVLNIGGQWFPVSAAQDAVLNMETNIINLPNRIVHTVINYNTGGELNIDHDYRNWTLKDASGSILFQLSAAGAICTNQIIAPVPAPHHNFDLPIYDQAANLVGYIRIYQP